MPDAGALVGWNDAHADRGNRLRSGAISTSNRGDRGETGSKAFSDTASDPGSLGARRIVKAATLEDAIAATRETLRKGALTISDLNGKTEAAVEPGSDITIHY